MKVFISKNAICNNLNIIKSHVKSMDKVIAVLKDNAYGHGIDIVGQVLIENGIQYFAVSNWEELTMLKKLSSECTILLLKPINNKEIALLKKYHNVILGVGNISYFQRVLELLGSEARIALKFDTGLGRRGFACDIDSINEICSMLKKNNIRSVDVMSHLSGTYHRSDDCKQKENLYQIMNYMEQIQGVLINRFHINSSNNLDSPLENKELIRVGAAIFGIPNKEIIDLQVAMKCLTLIEDYKSINIKGVNYYRCVLSVGYCHGMREDSIIKYNGQKVVIDHVYLDSTVILIKVDGKMHINDDVIIEISKCRNLNSTRILSQMTCDYGNSIYNQNILIE